METSFEENKFIEMENENDKGKIKKKNKNKINVAEKLDIQPFKEKYFKAENLLKQFIGNMKEINLESEKYPKTTTSAEESKVRKEIGNLISENDKIIQNINKIIEGLKNDSETLASKFSDEPELRIVNNLYIGITTQFKANIKEYMGIQSKFQEQVKGKYKIQLKMSNLR